MGRSAYEIAEALAGEGRPLNRTGVAEVLDRGRLRPHVAAPARRAGTASTRDAPPRAKVIDFAELPARCDTKLAGLLLAIPELVALDLPGVIAAAGYPGTRVIPAVSSVLSLLALKLVGVRRVSHVDDLAADPAAGLFAGLVALPKATALTTYSYRLSHERQRRFLAALDARMLAAGLAEGGDFDVDFHAVMHWGEDVALEKHYVPRRSQRTRSVLTFFAQDAGPTTSSTPTPTSPRPPRPAKCSPSATTGTTSPAPTRPPWCSTSASPPKTSSPCSTNGASASSPCACAQIALQRHIAAIDPTGVEDRVARPRRPLPQTTSRRRDRHPVRLPPTRSVNSSCAASATTRPR